MMEVLQVVAAVSSALAASFAFWQSWMMKRQLDGDRYLRRNERSVEIARQFADEVVPKSGYLNEVAMCSDTCKSLATRISRADVSEFTADEFESKVGEKPDEVLKKIRSELLDEENHEKLMVARMQLALTKPDASFPLPCASRSDEEGDGEDAYDEQKLQSTFGYMEFEHTATTLLNCLEHICMALSSEVADEAVLYPSLHQTFFSIVNMLYPNICRANSADLSDKFYMHTIDVYCKWMKRYRDQGEDLKHVGSRPFLQFKENKRRQLR